MSGTNFIPRDDQELYNWLLNILTKTNVHAAELKFTQVKTGTVPANSSINIMQADFSDEMLFKLENTGSSILRFCIGLSDTGSCSAPRGVVVNPAETITATVAELGNGEREFFNVTASSPGATMPGDYRVTLPNKELIDICSGINSLLKDIADVQLKRNTWKLSAEKKENTKQTVISEQLRPFIRIKIKGNENYTTDMGKDMDIIAEAPDFDPNTLKPELKGKTTVQGVLIIWKKSVADAINIYVDRKDGNGFVFLATDTQPDYLDTFALPTGINSAVWSYKAIYVIHDEEVGQWSEAITVTVSRNTGV